MIAPRRKLSLTPLVMVMFFTVSGGAYGLEDLVGQSGPGMALLLILLTPLIWSLPAALMVAELSTAMPVEGGYYAWVKRAMGPFWGFLEGWWSWITSFVDMAIYPVLFASYLSTMLARQFDFPLLEQSATARWIVTLVVIWTCAALNVRGVGAVGDSSNFFGLFILAPFAVMSVLGLLHLVMHPRPIWEPFVPPGAEISSTFSLGLFVVMWNYLGWDGLTTVSEEIENPRRNYPRALAITVALVTGAYLLPVAAGLAVTSDWSAWSAGSFPSVATEVGGRWLGGWLAIGGLVSAFGLFNALMLSISRLPFVLAADGYLPAGITRLHPKYGTPHVAIITCAVIYSIFTLNAFASLVVVDVILYTAALLLEFAALIALRIKEPGMERPFRVPGGTFGLAMVCILPSAVLVLAVASLIRVEGIEALYLSLAALASGPLLYPLLRRKLPRPTPG